MKNHRNRTWKVFMMTTTELLNNIIINKILKWQDKNNSWKIFCCEVTQELLKIVKWAFQGAG